MTKSNYISPSLDWTELCELSAICGLSEVLDAGLTPETIGSSGNTVEWE